jgi:hypothetical protein
MHPSFRQLNMPTIGTLDSVQQAAGINALVADIQMIDRGRMVLVVSHILTVLSGPELLCQPPLSSCICTVFQSYLLVPR